MTSGSDMRAVTDLVDERIQRPLVSYPAWLLLILVVSGVVAFTCVAYLGYPDNPPQLEAMFHDPWPILVWLYLLYLVIQISVLRHPNLRRYLVHSLLVSLISMTLVSGAWYTGLVDRLAFDTVLAIRLAGFYFLPLMVVGVLSILLSVRKGWQAVFWRVLNLARLVLVWTLLLLGVIGLLAGAELTAAYMHFTNHTSTGDPRVAFGHALLIFCSALASILGAFMALDAACALLIFRWRVFINTGNFLLFLLVLAYVWLPIFAIINSLIWLTGVSFRTPFFEPSASALLAVVVFVLTGRKTAVEAFNRLRGVPIQRTTV